MSYNVLRRRREMEKSVVVAGFIEAISHAWGEINTDSTPRFNNLGSMVLNTLYHFDFTLAEASTLLTRVDVQRALAAKLPKGRGRDAWQRAIQQPKEFGVKIESTENRFARFEENPLLRAMLGQTDVSLDLAKALEDGHIILVNLATERGKVSRQDADTFGTLLLSDLWAAAGERGKQESVRPFYLYVDEFQTMTTPSIARLYEGVISLIMSLSRRVRLWHQEINGCFLQFHWCLVILLRDWRPGAQRSALIGGGCF